MNAPADDAFVFNIVWVGTAFTYLRYFVASQLAHSGARYRFVCNACPPEEIARLEQFAERYPDRVIEVLEASPKRMVGHGDALDTVLATRDDGEFFCFIDPDILAKGPFLPEFRTALDRGADAVTSGRGIWSETDVVPAGHPGVNGEYFYGPDGYVFGSPHFAMYRRAPLAETLARWEVGLGTGGPELPDPVRERLRAAGQDYWVFDTGKIANILLQEDGHRLEHIEHANLLHIGGMSHYLSPARSTKWVVLEAGKDPEPEWVTWQGMERRFEVARFTAAVLRNVCDGVPAPEPPADLDPPFAARLAMVRDELVNLVATYAAVVE